MAGSVYKGSVITTWAVIRSRVALITCHSTLVPHNRWGWCSQEYAPIVLCHLPQPICSYSLQTIQARRLLWQVALCRWLHCLYLHRQKVFMWQTHHHIEASITQMSPQTTTITGSSSKSEKSRSVFFVFFVNIYSVNVHCCHYPSHHNLLL